MSDCPACGARVETPLVCGACGVLSSPESAPTPFQVFGLEPSFELDPEALRASLLTLTRRMHPDYFAADEDQRALAERNTAELNAAYEVLVDDFRRADWLVRSLGGPDENTERQMPQEFLMEVLEWNEALEAARGAGAGSAAANLDALEAELRERRSGAFADLARKLNPVPEAGAAELTDARRLLNAARYVDKTLSEIETLRLEQASST